MKARYFFVLLFFTTNIIAQNSINFGLNTSYYDSAMLSIVHSPKVFRTFAEQNHIEFLRYPAGTESRTYFWDRPDLIPQARKMYANFLNTTKLATDKSSKAKHNERMAESKEAQVDNSAYGDFLKFCQRSNITPIIVLSIWFYHDNDQVHVIKAKNGSMANADWNTILQNIQKQVQFSHTVYDGTIYWEIGNEDNHIFSAEDYAEFVTKYSTVIKKVNSSDKILITISNPTSKKIEDNWNENVLSYLAANKAISNVNYVAPHYYKAFSGGEGDEQLNTPAQIQARFKQVTIYSLSKNFSDLLSNYPDIHIFYTEFGLFKKASNPNYNTQLEALLTLYYLMQFNASPRVDGAIRHGFTQLGSGLYYNANTFKSLKYNFAPTDAQTNEFFSYISPKGKTIKIFFDNNPAKASKLATMNGYAYTIGNTSNGTIINLINFTPQSIPVNLGNIAGAIAGKKITATSYKFSDLQSKQWNVDKTVSTISSSISLLPYSYAVIQIAK